jgi:hypothetical protein
VTASSVPAPLTLAKVVCPNCHRPLRGDPASYLVLCEACSTATELSDTDLCPYPALFGSGEEPTYGPTWRVWLSVRNVQFSASQSAKTPWFTLDASTNSLNIELWIAAHGSATFAYYRAQNLLREPPTLVARVPAVPVASATRSLEDALELARPIFVAMVANAPGTVHRLGFDLRLDRAEVHYLR